MEEWISEGPNTNSDSKHNNDIFPFGIKMFLRVKRFWRSSSPTSIQTSHLSHIVVFWIIKMYRVISKKTYINKNYLYIEISIQQFHNLNIQIKLGRTGSLSPPQTIFTHEHIKLHLNNSTTWLKWGTQCSNTVPNFFHEHKTTLLIWIISQWNCEKQLQVTY